MMPSSAELAYFVEVAQTLNISRAAERLGISQPSLSLALRRLESEVGANLVTRGKRGVVLTPAGRQLLAHAKGLLEYWDNVKAQALASLQDVKGSYIIGCHPSVGLHVLGAIMPGLLRSYPDLELRLRHDLSRRIAEDVISHKADIGIVVNPVRHADLIIHHLCYDDMTLWAAPGAATDNAVLLCDPELAQSQILMKEFRQKGLSFSRMVVSADLEIIADLAVQGAGIGILPAQVARRARGSLVCVPSAPVLRDEHCLIFRIENKNVKSIQILSQTIRDHYSEG